MSTAGNFHGFNEGIKFATRSGLLYEIEKLLDNIVKDKKQLPKFLLLENVPNMVYKQHRADYDKWLNKLKKLGYSTKWGIIDSSKFGMVQKRKRVYALSWLNNKPTISDDLEETLLNQSYTPHS